MRFAIHDVRNYTGFMYVDNSPIVRIFRDHNIIKYGTGPKLWVRAHIMGKGPDHGPGPIL